MWGPGGAKGVTAHIFTDTLRQKIVCWMALLTATWCQPFYPINHSDGSRLRRVTWVQANHERVGVAISAKYPMVYTLSLYIFQVSIYIFLTLAQSPFGCQRDTHAKRTICGYLQYESWSCICIWAHSVFDSMPALYGKHTTIQWVTQRVVIASPPLCWSRSSQNLANPCYYSCLYQLHSCHVNGAVEGVVCLIPRLVYGTDSMTVCLYVLGFHPHNNFIGVVSWKINGLVCACF